MYSPDPEISGSADDVDEKSQALEIGKHAVWSLSSCKAGFGVAHLRDGTTETYWQSDGAQPHYINIQFLKKTAVQQISLYTNYKIDESYTPSKIAVKVGSNFHDLSQVTVVELDEPEGWMHINLEGKDDRPVRGFHYQLVVLANHQNGRDTHIRQVKVFEPDSGTSSGYAGTSGFEGADFLAMQTVR